MKSYIKITVEDVKSDVSSILKRYIGPKKSISYKQAARELEIEDRTLGSWIRGENPINLLSLIKLSLYLPTEFSLELVKMIQEYKYK